MPRRSREEGFCNYLYNFKKGQQKLFSFDLTPEWKTYTAEVDKAATPIDRVMFKFYVDKGSVADIDDCIVSPQGKLPGAAK